MTPAPRRRGAIGAPPTPPQGTIPITYRGTAALAPGQVAPPPGAPPAPPPPPGSIPTRTAANAGSGWSTAPATGSAAGTGGTPGVFATPGNVENLYGSTNFGAYGLRTADAYGNMAAKLGGPTATSGAVGAANANYGAAEGIYGKTGNQQSLYGQLEQRMSGPTTSGNAYAANSTYYNGPGSAETWYAKNGTRMDGPSAVGDYNRSLADFTTGRTALDEMAPEAGGYIRNASDVSDFVGRNMGAYEGPGMLEKFALGAAERGDPYVERLRQQSIDKLNQQMAARGHYSSGGALAAIGNQNAAFDAEIFNRLGDVLAKGQDAQFARLGQGVQATGASSANKLQQSSALRDMAGQMEAATMGRRRLGLDAAQMDSADALARFKAGADVAGQTQNFERGRATDRMTGAAAVDATENQRAGLLANVASGADADSLGRASGLISAGRARVDGGSEQDRAIIAQVEALMRGANLADNTDLQILRDKFGAAAGADKGERDRYGDAWDRLRDMINGKSGIIGAGFNPGTGGGAADSAINAGAGAGAAGAAGSAQDSAAWKDLAKLLSSPEFAAAIGGNKKDAPVFGKGAPKSTLNYWG